MKYKLSAKSKKVEREIHVKKWEKLFSRLLKKQEQYIGQKLSDSIWRQLGMGIIVRMSPPSEHQF